MPIKVERSGFLSQILYGKPSYAKQPAAFTANFIPTVLGLSDTSMESGRVLAKLSEKNERIKSGTGARVLGFDSKEAKEDKDKKIKLKKIVLWGVMEDKFYFTSGIADSGTWYNLFSNARTGLFRSFKWIDGLVRLPAMAFAALQLIFERGGWHLQTAIVRYFEKDSKTGTPIKMFLGDVTFYALSIIPMIVSVIGLGINVIGAIGFRFAVLVGKVVAEAFRMPLAIMGGAVGAVFGGIVSLTGSPSLKPWYHTMYLGMLDGIRPFAPEASAKMFLFYVDKTKDKDLSESSNQFAQPSLAGPMPWLSIALLTLSVAIVTVMSIVNIGIDQPLLQYLFDLSRVAEGGKGPFDHFTFMKLDGALSTTTFVTFALMTVGGLQAAFNGVLRGVKAFFNDMMYAEGEKKPLPSIIVPHTAPSIPPPAGAALEPQQQNGSTLVAHAAQVVGSINNNVVNAGKTPDSIKHT